MGKARIDDRSGRWLITGTSRGLGACLAALVEDQLGAEVLGVDRSPDPPARPARHLAADLATDDGVHRTVEAIQEFRPTVLINCAATNQSRFVADTSDEMLDEIVRVGFTTPFVLMREMGRLSRSSSEPRWVVNIASPYRLIGIRTHSLYCATKAALSRVGEALGVEAAAEGSGLRVVTVIPGAFNSGFRPVEAHDAWLVRTYRNRGARTPDQVAAELLRRLCGPAQRPHRTIRLGWDGPAFEAITRALASDALTRLVDRLIGQRLPDDQTGSGSRLRDTPGSTSSAASSSDAELEDRPELTG